MTKTIRIGGASGYWGESDMAWGQLLSAAPDYLVFDYLAEITMSLMGRVRRRNPALGYAPDFVKNLERYAAQLAEQGVKIISNAGGVNPLACAEAVRTVIEEAGLNLRVSVVTGDDLMDKLDRLSGLSDMFSGETLPDPETIVSANAYLGAFPIAKALHEGADIVITGRCVDSAVTLGALIHEFEWHPGDLDHLAQGSLVGHLIECGPQVTGGNFTDWQTIPNIADIGYPIAEVGADGACIITKPDGTGGRISYGTVVEQMLYEIGDPACYILPDVICDFTHVVIEELGPDRVKVSGARGRGIPEDYKVSVTASDGFRLSVLFFMVGADAVQKAQAYFDATMIRARRKLRGRNWADFDQVELEHLGNESHYGGPHYAREIAFRISVRHENEAACAMLLTEASGLALATPPGLMIYNGARPKVQPVIRLFSPLIRKSELDIYVDGDPVSIAGSQALSPVDTHSPRPPQEETTTSRPLIELAWLRSGDKGDKANIGIAARKPELMAYIWAAITEDAVRAHFAHFVEGDISRWFLAGTHSMNILMDRALGGGGMASLRNDAQGKSFGQVLGSLDIPIPHSLM